MQFNYYFLRLLTEELKTQLINKQVSAIFSQNKDELIISFNGNQFYIKANLDSQASLLSFPASFARAKKNSVNLFDELIELTVKDVRQFLNERSFSIQFDDNYELLFRLHGRHSNILLFRNNEVVHLFKKGIKKDNELDSNSLDRAIDQSDQAIIDTSFNIQKLFPTFDKNIKRELEARGFFTEEQAEVKLSLLHSVLEELNDSRFYVLKESPSLRLLKSNQECEVFTSAVEASNHLARSFYTTHGFSQLKNSFLSKINKEIKKSESYILQNTQKLGEIENRRGYEELANILMANLHVQKDSAAKEIELFDFYANQQIKIKLKPHISLQHNAENLYRKAKNESKEIDVLKTNISQKKKTLIELQEKKKQVDGIQDIRELKAFDKSNTVNKTKESLPFMEFDIDGFKVYAGKNAKNNDLLTQKFARKDDLWFHAKDVSGSHVIIRNPNGVNIPKTVIEQVAQLAAWYSKRKTDSICPVIYTQKKFIRKPKGSLPGQVIVTKEQAILVEPSRYS